MKLLIEQFDFYIRLPIILFSLDRNDLSVCKREYGC